MSDRVKPRRFQTIEHGDLRGVSALVVHQTDAPTAQHTFNVTWPREAGRIFSLRKMV